VNKTALKEREMMKLDILPDKLAAECEGKHIKYEKLVNVCKQMKSAILYNDLQGGSDMSKHAKTFLMAVQIIWNELEEVKAKLEAYERTC